MSKQPNIVFVIADDSAPAYHGCYGGRTPTPNIDRLAREGVRFDRNYCCASLCNPSRYTIFTGQYVGRAASASAGCAPDEPYAIKQNAEVEPGDPTLATILREAGYYTGHVGKWHSNFSCDRKGVGRHTIPRDADLDDPAIDKLLRENQAFEQDIVRRYAGFEEAHAVSWGNLDGKSTRLKYHNPAWQTDAACDFIDRAARDGRPFYLHVANSVPHSPDCTRSLNVDHRYTLGGKLDKAPSSHPADDTVLERMRAAGVETNGPIAGINAGTMMIDDQIGAILERLAANGLDEDTIVVYTADHGWQGKGSCYRGGIHMPFVMRWPAGIAAGTVVDGLFSHADVFPTLLAAAGAQPPAGHVYDGYSILPTLTEGAPLQRQVAYSEMGVARTVIKGSWQYIAFRFGATIMGECERGEAEMLPCQSGSYQSAFGDLNIRTKPSYFAPNQLYNLEQDPNERVNVVDDPAYADVVRDMQAELAKITSDLSGPFPMEVPAFMRSDRYREMAQARHERNATLPYYPQGYDAEVIFNFNQPDPLAEK